MQWFLRSSGGVPGRAEVRPCDDAPQLVVAWGHEAGVPQRRPLRARSSPRPGSEAPAPHRRALRFSRYRSLRETRYRGPSCAPHALSRSCLRCWWSTLHPPVLTFSARRWRGTGASQRAPPQERASTQVRPTSCSRRASTRGHGTIQCLSVIVTVTVRSAMRYPPASMAWEKLPDRSSPTRVAPCWRAARRALASSEAGPTVVSRLKVLVIVFSAPYSCFTSRSASVPSRPRALG